MSQCGNNPPLTVYCLGSLPQINQGIDRLSIASIPSPVLIASLAMLVLLIDMIVRDRKRFRFPIPLLRTFWRGLGDKFSLLERLERGRLLASARSVILFLYWGTWICLDLGMLICLSLHLQDLQRLTTDNTGLLSKPELWSYGQLISGMVWGPVLAKYVYYNICEYPSSSLFGIPYPQHAIWHATILTLGI